MKEPIVYKRYAESKLLTLDKIMAQWVETMKLEKDEHVAICSAEGDGKTVLSTHVVDKTPGADLWNNFVYTSSMKELLDKYEAMQENSVMVLDEALDFTNRYEWAKRETKDFVKLVRGKVRKEKKALFLYNIQLFRDLHTYWRNHRIGWWLELTPRQWFNDGNKCFVLEKTRVPFMTGKRDVWLLEENEKIWLEKLRKGTMQPDFYMNMIRVHPFYKGEFGFRAWDDGVKKKYFKFRSEAMEVYGKDVEGEKIGKREEMWMGRTALVINLCIQKGMTQEEIGKYLDISHSHISELLQRFKLSQKTSWIDKKINMKVSPQEDIKVSISNPVS
jgi:predicted XRE-type DNA-binding protein